MKHRSAFTLVELSIVLVILGLLVGGVLSGQSLIRAAELRTVGTQKSQYLTAVHAFRDKYMGLPGDLPNATSFWGEQDAGAACITSASTTTRTCNGNGDGQVEFAAGLSHEIFRFWQHLANAGLIEGTYTGASSFDPGYTSGHGPGNAPRGRFTGSFWRVGYIDRIDASNEMSNVWGSGTTFRGRYGHSLTIMGSGTFYPTGLFSPDEVWNMDKKMDDGMPGTGNLVLYAVDGNMNAPLRACTTASGNTDSADLAATYTSTGGYSGSYGPNYCLPLFRNAF